ncbi:unnamed protein product [Caenorhabditis auriculariae]|uniref:Reverse transcriptase domain-containing protein n=1 Tax=Caenorhabditis auriculariae TaxID=2777116 RepID=A0A8S1HD53_9PELO|nr:unnamed protein product [Caenorhabditis auriculariae]
MAVQGRFNAKFNIFDARHRSTTGSGRCYVTEKTDLLGLDWLIAILQYRHLPKELSCRMTTTCLNQTREESVAQLCHKYASVFEEGLGSCTKTKAKLFLKPESRPVYIKKRPLPYASQPAIDAEIDRLVNGGVLSSIDYSQRAAPIVAVKKANGTIRMCADFSTGLNDALMLHQHPLPTAEDVFNKLNGGQLYTQINFADAYLHIELDDSTKEILTVNTHRRLYRYNRLPFGVKSAPGILQEVIDSMISGLNGVAAYLDDIIVTGRSTDEHRRNLEALFDRIHNYGFRVRLPK